MKQSITVLLVLALGALPLDIRARKLALLAGVGAYAEAPFAAQPLQAAKALRLMRTTLLQQGFSEADILVLSDANATRNGIRTAFEQHLLQAGRGDVAVFYFYGHGVQITDDGTDEADKLDEALVPHDGLKTNEKDHRNLIRDDELGRWIKQVREQAGPDGQVLVLLDACHSGGGLRGGKSRAKADRYKIANNVAESDGLAPFIAFYSSMPHQSSLEMPVKDVGKLGLLTWAFCKAMPQMDEGGTFRGLFEQTALHIATESLLQTPQLEGTQDMQIFGGRVAPPPPYFKAVTMLGDRKMLLTGGLMQGLQAGARLVLYPPETRDTAGVAPLAFGVVQEKGLGLLECNLALDRPLAEAQGQSAWVFVAERRFSGYTLALRLEIADAAQAAQIRTGLSGMEAVQIVAGHEAALTLTAERDKLLLRSADGLTLWEERYSAGRQEDALQSLRLTLGNYLQAQFLRSLEFEGSAYRAAFSVQVGANSGTPAAAGALRVAKDTAFLKVVNRGAKPVYYTIIDIDARNTVNVLLPRPGDLPADYRLEPEAESPLHRVRFNAPGREVLKLITTDRPIDLRPAVANRGRDRRGRGFFEVLFAESYWQHEKSRGPAGAYQGNEAGVETVVLEVVE